MKHLAIILFTLLSLFITSACTSGDSSKEADYDTTKKMVVDILQTEDGKKALAEIISDDNMKQQLIMDSDTVKKAISETVASDKSKEMWKALFDDPKFVEKFSKAIEDEQAKLMKDLMSDPDYQEKMQDLMQDPEMVKHTMQLLKSKEFTEHLQKTVQDTFENPMFQAKIQDILLKVSEKQSKKKSEAEGQGGSSKSNNQDKQESESE